MGYKIPNQQKLAKCEALYHEHQAKEKEFSEQLCKLIRTVIDNTVFIRDGQILVMGKETKAELWGVSFCNGFLKVEAYDEDDVILCSYWEDNVEDAIDVLQNLVSEE